MKKGKIDEIFSKAQYADDPLSYEIIYRDLDQLKKVNLHDFLIESNNFETIPVSRIELIKKNNKILFKKFKKSEV